MMTVNRESADWLAVRKWLVAAIEKERDDLERPGLTEVESEFIRGQIRGWRLLIEAAEPEIAERTYVETYNH